MSKRPDSGTNVLPRVRGVSGFLRDRPIWIKLALIMLVPTIATVAVGIGALVTNVNRANTADKARTLAALTGDAGLLVDNLQAERAAAVTLLDIGPNGQGAGDAKTTYQSLFPATNQDEHVYSDVRRTVSGLPGSFTTLLNSIDTALSALPALRDQVVAGTASMDTLTARYGTLIESLISTRDAASQLAGDSTLSYQMRATSAVSQAKEYLSQERIIGLQIFTAAVMTPDSQKEFIATLTGQEQALGSFKVVATPAEQSLLDQSISGPALSTSQTLEQGLKNAQPNAKLDSNLEQGGQTGWDDAMVSRAKLLRNVEQTLDIATVRNATVLRNNVDRQVLIEAGLLVGLVLIAVIIAWFVARSMNRALRELRHGALAVARYGLPQAVARLRDPALATQYTPQQVAIQIAETLPVRSRDEFGQVTEAFNAVHLEAVRTAAEQAALRASVATMFINLARRSQILVDRLIGHLDRLERGEEDPDRLAELFQLDHLATRMRRNDENLLVLAGADSTRVQREPAALIDVLRAAQSEVEHYTRIEFGVVDRDIEVAAHAVNDLVHLVAELFDNATAFSPPDSTVIVEARRVGDRAVLYVEDHGIGMSIDQLAELNDRMSQPPAVDVAVSRMMGLVVVARLAARHGVKVELRPAAEHGTVADVLLPTTVLVPRALAGRPRGAPSLPREVPALPVEQLPPPRSPFATPLALESGGGRRTSRPATPFRNNGANGLDPNRPLPAWSDLTGASGLSGLPGAGLGGSLFSPRTPAGPPAGPLPQRRAGEPRGFDEADEQVAPSEPRAFQGPIPQQMPPTFAEPPSGLPPAGPPTGMPPSGQPPGTPPSGHPPIEAVDADVVDERAATPAATAPAWPPSPPGAATPAPAGEAGSPGGPQALHSPVPENLAAALDITSELPHVERPDGVWEAPGAMPAAGGEPLRVTTYADQTMELPIFRELESLWFRTHTEAPSSPQAVATSAPPVAIPHQAQRSAPPAPPAQRTAPPDSVASRPATPPGYHTDTQAEREPLPVSPTTGPPAGDGRMPAPQPVWRTAADDGWVAATRAAEPTLAGTTDAGLPKRVPMAQLVPGGVDRGSSASNRRSPEQVRGLLSAYHRGVQRGRARGDEAQGTESGPTTGEPSQGGKEQGA